MIEAKNIGEIPTQDWDNAMNALQCYNAIDYMGKRGYMVVIRHVKDEGEFNEELGNTWQVSASHSGALPDSDIHYNQCLDQAIATLVSELYDAAKEGDKP